MPRRVSFERHAARRANLLDAVEIHSAEVVGERCVSGRGQSLARQHTHHIAHQVFRCSATGEMPPTIALHAGAQKGEGKGLWGLR